MRTKALTTIAAGMLATAAMAAPAVAASDPGRTDTRRTLSESTIQATVTTWTGANVRSCASTNCGVVYSVGANTTLNAVCWDYGQYVNQNGIAHDKWVQLLSGNWIWGGLLKGNETGNISVKCS
ncbi:hypothetical protein [Streptomyces sp. CRN 30]|uniref:hypothetical protein n=1 Tax=Streptomyces sp. CRN 30 TaxID=3075613 RepID=UPI002A81452A|nr:hypothetical protein [Streptomyces sp. CRN 30]